MKVRQSIVCPKCGIGFIKMREDEPSKHSGFIHIPAVSNPRCTRCYVPYVVKINTEEMVIELEAVGGMEW